MQVKHDSEFFTDWYMDLNFPVFSKWKADRGSVNSISLCSTGRSLLSAGRAIKLWDLSTRTLLKVSRVGVIKLLYSTGNALVNCYNSEFLCEIYAKGSFAKIYQLCSVWCMKKLQKYSTIRDKIIIFIPPETKFRGGILDSPCSSVRPSVRPSALKNPI